MNETTVEEPTVADATVEAAGPQEPLDLALADLCEKVDLLYGSALEMQRVRDDGFFKYLSKPHRNKLMTSLIEQSDEVRDLTRAVVNGLKKIKRERIPEDMLDMLLSTQAEEQW